MEITNTLSKPITAPVEIASTLASKYASIQSPKIRSMAETMVGVALDTEAGTRTAAITCYNASQLDKDSIKAEGFKGFADLVDHIFPIKSTAATQLAKVGGRFLVNPSEIAAKVAEMLPTYTLYYLYSLTDEELQAGMDDGHITPKMTQAEAKAFGKAIKEARGSDNGGNTVDGESTTGAAKGKIVPRYSVKAFISVFTDRGPISSIETRESVPMADVPDILTDKALQDLDSNYKKVPSPVDGWTAHYYTAGNGFAVVLVKIMKAGTTPVKDDKEAEIERLKALLRENGLEI